MSLLQQQPSSTPPRNDDFFSKFKYVLFGGIALIVLLFGGLILTLILTSRSEEPDTPTSLFEGGADDGTTTEGTEGEAQAAEAQTFKGKGVKLIPFKSTGGLTIVKLAHLGPANFVVQYGSGGSNQLLINEVGKYEGSRALGLAAGDYTLDINTVGDWEVQISAAKPTTAPAPPQKLSGDGQSASTFFSLKPGPATFRVTHEGTGFFAPSLFRSDGTNLTNLANELGKFNGQKVVEIAEEGIYLVDVPANGPWTIDVSQ